MFALQNANDPMDNPLPGLELSGIDTEVKTAKSDILVNLYETPDGIQGQLDYNSETILPQTAERFASHFLHLIDSIIERPAANVASLQMMNAVEMDLAVSGGMTRTEIPYNSVAEAFSPIAEAYADKAAILFEGEELSYGELNRRANRIAHHLHRLGSV